MQSFQNSDETGNNEAIGVSDEQDLSIVNGTEEEEVEMAEQNADDVDIDDGFDLIKEELARLQMELQSKDPIVE